MLYMLKTFVGGHEYRLLFNESESGLRLSVLTDRDEYLISDIKLTDKPPATAHTSALAPPQPADSPRTGR